jgi:hypothetical protein
MLIHDCASSLRRWPDRRRAPGVALDVVDRMDDEDGQTAD